MNPAPLERHHAHKEPQTRRHLRVITGEGASAVVVLQLLAGPFQTGYLLQLGATSSQIGLVLSITTFVNFLQIAAAVWMQRSMTNRKLWAGVFAFFHRSLWVSCGAIPFLLPQHLWVGAYICLYTMAFISNAYVAVIWTSMMGDIVPSAVRGKYFGFRNTVLGAWAMVIVFVGGQVLKWYPGEQGYSILFAACAVCAIVNTASFAFYPNPPFAKPANTALLPMLRKPFQDRFFIKAIAFLAVWLFFQGVAVPLYSYVMLKVLKVGIDAVSYITVAQMAITMAAYYFWGIFNAKYSTRAVLFWTLPFIAMSCFSWIGLAALPVYVVLVLAHLFLGIGLGGYNQLVFNFIIGDTPRDARPMFVAVYSALTGFAAFLGPLVGGWIYGWVADAPDWVQKYGVSASIGLFLFGLALTYGRKILLAPKRLDA